MKFFSKLYFVLIVLIAFTSCKTNKTHKDQVAAAISSLESPFFMSTLTPSVLIEKSGVQDGVLPLTQEVFVGFFLSEGKTGINNEEQVQIVVAESGGIIPNAYLFIALKNATDFEKALKQELGAVIQEKNGKKYYRNDDYSFVVAWNESLAIVSNIPISLDNLFSKSNLNSKKAAIALVELLDITESGKIDENFRTFMDKGGDIYTYFHGQNIYSALSQTRFIPSKNKREIKMLLEGSVIESAINFNEDNIEWKSDYLLSDSLLEKFKFLSDKSISEEMLKYGLNKNPIMVVSTALIPSEGFSLMNEYASSEEAGKMDSVFKELDFTKKDLENMFAGDMVFMVSHIDSLSIANKENAEPVYGIALKVLDSKKVKSLISNKLSSENGIFLTKDSQYVQIHENVLFVSNSQIWANQIKIGKGVNIKGENNEWLKSPISFKINQLNNELFEGEFDDLTKFISEVLSVTGEISNSNSSLVLNLNETGKNALRYILELFISEYETYMQEDNEELIDMLDEEVINTVLEEVDVDKLLETISEISKEL